MSSCSSSCGRCRSSRALQLSGACPRDAPCLPRNRQLCWLLSCLAPLRAPWQAVELGRHSLRSCACAAVGAAGLAQRTGGDLPGAAACPAPRTLEAADGGCGGGGDGCGAGQCLACRTPVCPTLHASTSAVPDCLTAMQLPVRRFMEQPGPRPSAAHRGRTFFPQRTPTFPLPTTCQLAKRACDWLTCRLPI